MLKSFICIMKNNMVYSSTVGVTRMPLPTNRHLPSLCPVRTLRQGSCNKFLKKKISPGSIINMKLLDIIFDDF